MFLSLLAIFIAVFLLVLITLVGRYLPRVALILSIPSVLIALLLWSESNAPFAHEEGIAIGVAVVQGALKAVAAFFALAGLFLAFGGLLRLRHDRAAHGTIAHVCTKCGAPVPAGQTQCPTCLGATVPAETVNNR